MRRLVLALSVFIAWAIVTRKRTTVTLPDAYPFPTSASHERIVLDDEASVRAWCEKLGCSEGRLRAAIDKAGASADVVRYHLALEA